MNNAFSFEMLTGRTSDHIETLPTGERIHRDMKPSLAALTKKAEVAGFQIQVVSGFRDYATQLRIWNEKATGKRPLLDPNGKSVDFSKLAPEEIVAAILRWSALPGASRHHWGTEIDVVDKNATPAGYQVQLVPGEVEEEGIFAPMHDWLDDHFADEGFFRPFAEDLGGVSPERWHLSYAPIAKPCFEQYTLELFKKQIEESDLELKSLVLENADRLFKKYVRNITLPE